MWMIQYFKTAKDTKSLLWRRASYFDHISNIERLKDSGGKKKENILPGDGGKKENMLPGDVIKF